MRDDIIEVIAEEDAEIQPQAEEVIAEDPAVSYEQKIAVLEEKLRAAEEERSERERELRCLALLGEAGLPAELLHAVIPSRDMEGTVDIIRRAVQSRVDFEISKRCRTEAPAAGVRAPLTKDELMRLPVAELQRLRDLGTAL